MEWVIWGFGGLAVVVALIIAVSGWIVFRRDRDVANQGIKPGVTRISERSSPTRGVPKSR